MLTGRSGEQLRLPQDVEIGAGLGVPDLAVLQGSVASYALRHAIALEVDGFAPRVEACWGLVARGSEAVGWCIAGFESGESDWADDAAGVLRWVGVPDAARPELRRLLDGLPEGEAADFLIGLFPEVDTVGADVSGSMLEPGQLFEGRMLPFTEPISFIELPLEQVVADLRAWMQRLERRVSYLDLHEPLPAMVARFEPFAIPSWKYLLVQTASAWTAFFDQGEGGHEWMQQLSKPYQARSLMTNHSRHVVRDGRVRQYGGSSFWLFRGFDSIRTLQASQQGRWQWDESGEPAMFEDTSRYTAKRIADRFTLEDINRYCAALGIRRNDPDFYLPNGVLVTKDNSDYPDGRRMSAAQWRDEHLRT